MSPLFKLTKYKIVVFDEIYILFHFNIILKHNGMSSTKITGTGGADKSLARPGRKQATATEDFDFHISYL